MQDSYLLTQQAFAQLYFLLLWNILYLFQLHPSQLTPLLPISWNSQLERIVGQLFQPPTLAYQLDSSICKKKSQSFYKASKDSYFFLLGKQTQYQQNHQLPWNKATQLRIYSLDRLEQLDSWNRRNRCVKHITKLLPACCPSQQSKKSS